MMLMIGPGAHPGDRSLCLRGLDGHKNGARVVLSLEGLPDDAEKGSVRLRGSWVLETDASCPGKVVMAMHGGGCLFVEHKRSERNASRRAMGSHGMRLCCCAVLSVADPPKACWVSAVSSRTQGGLLLTAQDRVWQVLELCHRIISSKRSFLIVRVVLFVQYYTVLYCVYIPQGKTGNRS